MPSSKLEMNYKYEAEARLLYDIILCRIYYHTAPDKDKSG